MVLNVRPIACLVKVAPRILSINKWLSVFTPFPNYPISLQGAEVPPRVIWID